MVLEVFLVRKKWLDRFSQRKNHRGRWGYEIHSVLNQLKSEATFRFGMVLKGC